MDLDQMLRVGSICIAVRVVAVKSPVNSLLYKYQCYKRNTSCLHYRSIAIKIIELSFKIIFYNMRMFIRTNFSQIIMVKRY